MTSTVDKLLLTSSQLAEVEQLKKTFREYQEKGDTAGMNWAHEQVENIRAKAGYSGGADGSDFSLLPSSQEAPDGYRGYESLVNRYAQQGMDALISGYEGAMAELDAERKAIEARNQKNQSGARSAAWNRQRLAQSGLLTRGYENTGIADVVTATALNQAAANAYQTLLNSQEALAENDTARVDARADTLTDIAELYTEIGGLLGDGYQDFYQKDAERQQELLKQEQDLLHKLKVQEQEHLQEKERKEQDYYYDLALAQLKRQWALEDQRLK